MYLFQYGRKLSFPYLLNFIFILYTFLFITQYLVLFTYEASIWDLWIQEISHFTSSQGYGTLSFLLPGTWDTVINIFLYFQGYRIFCKIDYGDICQFIRAMPVNYKGICNPLYNLQASPMHKSLH